ncbi:MAG: methionyl-tRNA formyltransferase [Anaerolineae bacterium]|nr:methionyl-tRNA formyltransferase [Anaerolineae bacterium]
MAQSHTRIVFMGTPDFAVPTLHALLDAPDMDIVGIVTQPDRPAGRGQQVHQSPVKQVADAAGLPTIQPANLRKAPDAADHLRAWKPDFLVVVAFGQILRQDVLDIPHIAPVNVHASLLPRWRGAAPIQAAIRAGDIYTGITTMIMDAGMDTGPILLQDSIPIAPDETGQSLHDKLAPLGANLLVHTLRWLAAGSIAPHAQPERAALITYAPQLTKADGQIDWNQSAIEIDRHVRAFTPWPGTYTHWAGKRVKINAGYPVAGEAGIAPGQVRPAEETPLAGDAPFGIGTGRGLYIPTRLQLEGRKAVSALDFINGLPDFLGGTLE